MLRVTWKTIQCHEVHIPTDLLHHLHSGASIFWVFMKPTSKQLLNSISWSYIITRSLILRTLCPKHQTCGNEENIWKVYGNKHYLSTLGLKPFHLPCKISVGDVCQVNKKHPAKPPSSRAPLYIWSDTRATKLSSCQWPTPSARDKPGNRAIAWQPLSQNTLRALSYSWCHPCI